MFVQAVNLEAGVQRSGTMMWADDIYNYQGITPTFAQVYIVDYNVFNIYDCQNINN